MAADLHGSSWHKKLTLLVSIMQECPDRLTADLRRYYGVRLSDMEAGIEDPLEVAHMVAHLPRGSNVGQYYGGWLAIPEEVEALWEVSHLIAATNSRRPSSVKPRKPPKGVKAQLEHDRKFQQEALRWKRRRQARG